MYRWAPVFKGHESNHSFLYNEWAVLTLLVLAILEFSDNDVSQGNGQHATL